MSGQVKTPIATHPEQVVEQNSGGYPPAWIETGRKQQVPPVDEGHCRDSRSD
jgi:hypothetical protein